MGLTCSVLGHAFEAAELEREREEQGSEAVTVVREIETCRRCGERRVVSENKEVTAIVDPEEVGVDAGDADTASPDDAETTAPPDDAETTAPPEEAEPQPAASDSNAGATDDGVTEDATDDDFEPPTDPAEDDAEILEDSREEPRTPGQWPDDDDGFEPSSLTGDAAEESEGATVVDDADEASPDVEPAATASSVPRGDYVCPSCGFSTPAERSSLRAGDACPECQQGYLESR